MGIADETLTAGVTGMHTGDGQGGFFQTIDSGNTFPALEAVSNAAAPTFSSANLGAGSAGEFEIANPGNQSNALNATTDGAGSAALLLVTDDQNASPALQAITAGIGPAGSFQNTNPANSTSTLLALTAGLGPAASVLAANAANAAPALFAGTLGTGAAADFRSGAAAVLAPGMVTATMLALNSRLDGPVGHFENLHIDNSDEALFVQTMGRGSAGAFLIDNPDPGITTGNPAAAVFAETNGFGRAGFFGIQVAPISAASSLAGGGANNMSPALEATTDGNGPAGRFSITHPDSPSGTNALEATTDGLGGAARFEVFNMDSDAAALTSVTHSVANGSTAFFTSTASANSTTTLEVEHQGLGRAGSFLTSDALNPSATFSAKTFGTGPAGLFDILNDDPAVIVNAAPALQARTEALGAAGRFVIDLPNAGTGQGPVNNSAAVHASTNASGNAGKFESTGTDFVNPTLDVSSAAKGIVGRFVGSSATNTAATIVGETQGRGPVAQFTNFNATNPIATLDVSTNAAGVVSAARFQNTNAANSGDVVAALANNSRHALFAQQSGPGEAAHFEIADPGNTNNAVFIKNNGEGIALSVENSNPNFAALALAVRGKSALNGQVDILGSGGGPVPVNITGNVGISGNLTVSGGQICGPVCGPVKMFKIDHPLDPENKFLVHASAPTLLN